MAERADVVLSAEGLKTYPTAVDAWQGVGGQFRTGESHTIASVNGADEVAGLE
jgi:hypothetical protein